MLTSEYMALEEVVKGEKKLYSSVDAGAFIFDRFRSDKDLYLILSHFLTQSIASDKNIEITDVNGMELVDLCKKSKNKIDLIVLKGVSCESIKKFATAYTTKKLALISSQAPGEQKSESNFNKKHEFPGFDQQDLLFAGAIKQAISSMNAGKK